MENMIYKMQLMVKMQKKKKKKTQNNAIAHSPDPYFSFLATCRSFTTGLNLL